VKKDLKKRGNTSHWVKNRGGARTGSGSPGNDKRIEKKIATQMPGDDSSKMGEKNAPSQFADQLDPKARENWI